MKPRALIWAAFSALTVTTAVSHATGDEKSATTPRARGPKAALALAPRAIVDRYCLNCHNEVDLAGDLAFDTLDIDNVGKDAATWEKAAQTPRPRDATAWQGHTPAGGQRVRGGSLLPRNLA
jgi:hypothetical protein